MISLNFDIVHPFNIKFKNFWSKSWTTPFKNKFIELEVCTNDSLIGFNFRWTTKCDHAGLDIQLSLLGLCLHFNFYDHRHWNYQENRYYVHEDTVT